MLQHWSSSVIWNTESVTFQSRDVRKAQFLFQRIHVLSRCICTTHFALIVQTNSHSSYVLTSVFDPRESILAGVKNIAVSCASLS